MELEQSLLSAFLKDRKAYETFVQIGNIDELSPIARNIASAIGGYYELDSEIQSCSKEIIEGRLLRAALNEKHHGPIKDVLAKLDPRVSTANVVYELRSLHKKSVGQKLSLALANGQAEHEVSALIAEYSKGISAESSGQSSDLVDALDTTDLTEEKQQNEYIRIYPKQLNDRLDGGCLRGHHILVYARPETGKTLFSINLTYGFLSQRLAVLYVANEEPAADIRDRIRGRILRWSKQEVRSRRDEAAARLRESDPGRIGIIQETTFAAVRSALVKPRFYDVVVLDQIRNMRLKSDGRTAELEAAGIEARAIAKEFEVLVISVTQAGDSATNKVYLDMSDVDSSKTGIPASADLMVGLGSDEAMKLNGLMGISLPKNKLSGRHDKFTVQCNFQTGEVI